MSGNMLKLAVGLLFKERDIDEILSRGKSDRYAAVSSDIRKTAQKVTESKSLIVDGDTFTEWFYVRNRLMDLAFTVLMDQDVKQTEALNSILLDLSQRDVDFWQGPRFPNRPRTIVYHGTQMLAGELETAQLAMGVAIAYDWAYSFLHEDVKKAVERVLLETARPLLRNSVKFQSEHWVMNHLCVISTGLILSSLVQMSIDPAYEQDIEIAQKGLSLWLEKIDDDGSYGESFHYWAYPVNCLFFGIHALKTVLERDVDNIQRLSKSFEWALHNQVGYHQIDGFTAPVAVSVNQYDCPYVFQMEGPEALLFTKEFKNPVAQWYIDTFLLPNPPRPDSLHHVWHTCNSVLVALDDPSLKPKSPAQQNASTAAYYSDTGFVYFRDSWGKCGSLDGDMVFSLMSGGGGRSRSHEHYDKNSFSLFANGEYFLIDPGHSCYRGDSHKTYDTATYAHNTLNIDQKDQSLSFLEKGMLHDEAKAYVSYHNRAYIVGRNFQKDVSYIASEAKNCYDPALRQFTRRVWFMRPHYFLVWDRIDASNISGQCNIGFSINNRDGKTVLHESDGTLLVERPRSDLQISFVVPSKMSFDTAPAKLHLAYHILPDQEIEGKSGSAIRVSLTEKQRQNAFDHLYILYPKKKGVSPLDVSVHDQDFNAESGLVKALGFSITCQGQTNHFDIQDETVTFREAGRITYQF
jgi:hypothetical protein